ncbi:MAG: hypothetical protein J5621_06890 [Paludibacteraceae bacterium]|nr:hypothetical protein [Paludibacteraceae bacterium]
MAYVLKKLINTLKNSMVLLIISAIIGLSAYVIGFFFVKVGTWHEFWLQVGNVLVIGVVIGFLSNGEEFLSIYQKAIQNTIYGEDFLANQKDISRYWRTISKQMFKNKFPDIHEEFLSVINANFPTDEVSYYNDYEMISTMEWENKANNIVKVTDVVSFDLIAADATAKFDYPLRNWIKSSNEGNTVETKMLYFKVDGKDKKNTTQSEVTYENGERCEKWDFKLEGNKEYHIEYKIEKKFNLLEDHCKAFKAKYIVKNCRVEYEVPQDVHIQFECRGTLEDFEDVGSQRSNKISKRYRGILLPQQGFLMALHKIPNEK